MHNNGEGDTLPSTFVSSQDGLQITHAICIQFTRLQHKKQTNLLSFDENSSDVTLESLSSVESLSDILFGFVFDLPNTATQRSPDGHAREAVTVWNPRFTTAASGTPLSEGHPVGW